MVDGSTLDYRHRPAKNIERHLIVDACRRVLANYPADYQYIGFGAFEFIDFQLVHRALGITKMISIEKKDTTRHEFNKPFRSIRVVQGQSNELFRRKELSLDTPTIIWLDYTTALKGGALDDLLQVTRTIAAPSLLILTFNAQPERVVSERFDRYAANVGTEFVAEGSSDDTLSNHGLALAQRVSATALIEKGLRERKDTGLQWFQALNFHYQDGQLMQTLGGVLLPAAATRKDVDRAFEGLDFYTPSDDYLDLKVPVITSKERILLDRQLPKKTGTPLRATGIPPEEVEAYRRVYRYLHLAGLQSAVETTWTA